MVAPFVFTSFCFSQTRSSFEPHFYLLLFTLKETNQLQLLSIERTVGLSWEAETKQMAYNFRCSPDLVSLESVPVRRTCFRGCPKRTRPQTPTTRVSDKTSNLGRISLVVQRPVNDTMILKKKIQVGSPGVPFSFLPLKRFMRKHIYTHLHETSRLLWFSANHFELDVNDNNQK